MRSDRLQRHYDKLDPLERLSVAIAAHNRGDSDEVESLSESCPDPEEYLAVMQTLESMASMLSLRLLATDITLLAADGDEYLGGPEVLIEVMDVARHMWAGWREWCTEAGLPPREALRLAPIGDRGEDPVTAYVYMAIDTIEEISLDLAPDPETAREWRNFYADLWAQSMGVDDEV